MKVYLFWKKNNKQELLNIQSINNRLGNYTDNEKYIIWKTKKYLSQRFLFAIQRDCIKGNVLIA
jgi:hypothetical protein